MSRARNAFVFLGLAALAYGAATAVEPDLAGLLVVSRLYVPLLGVLALLQGYRVVRRRRRSTIRGAETGDPELVVPTDAPGSTFDRRVATVADFRRASVRERQRLRDHLRETAVAVVARHFDCSREEADARVEDGTWTDDPFAASFLGGRDVPSPPLLARLRHAFRAESRFQRDAVRTADAIVELAGRERR